MDCRDDRAETWELHWVSVRVLVSGSGGFIGSALTKRLTDAGHEVVRLRRPSSANHESSPADGIATWDPVRGSIDAEALTGVEAAVHLAGEGIANRRWSPGVRDRIMRSRSEGTRLLSSALARLSPKPSVLISASAVGYYGDRGDDVITEVEGPGQGFLVEVCQAWEKGTAPAERAGIRVAHMRSGIVLDRRGGFLAKQLPLFRLGLGARLGTGQQYVSWISLQDEIGAFMHVLGETSLQGPVNVTSPYPVTNAELTRQLAGSLS
ncbi:MAG: TIGR01777 family oxidoreductase, partial [Acidimicrobiales bacterium]